MAAESTLSTIMSTTEGKIFIGIIAMFVLSFIGMVIWIVLWLRDKKKEGNKPTITTPEESAQEQGGGQYPGYPQQGAGQYPGYPQQGAGGQQQYYYPQQ